ncbi:PTS transporter subunit EIIC [Mycoplasmopsis pulmonis]|uniref:PTS transporter subunit EIIC n=1 Tax=Mycoplasmopsis pulmonis TaxID=2107 RepID=UPI002ACD7483|nr:PTS transporter subunit EIIC [Mycoplasmopsis pulmonis]
MNKFFKTYFFNFKNKSRTTLVKLSQAFMLPISILPIAGLLLGIGGAIGANSSTSVAIIFANFFKGASDIIFANLAMLFGASVVISFTNKNRIYGTFMFIIGYLIFLSIQSVFIHFNDKNEFVDIFFFHTNPDNAFLVGKTLGISSLQTSIFGGIIVATFVVFIMNRWSEIELPYYLGFFSGIKLVPFILLPFSVLLAIAFLILWPFIGIVIAWIGKQASYAPGGVDGLVYGMLARALMPLGLHHIVIAIAWQTKLGGELSLNEFKNVASSLGVLDTFEIQSVIKAFDDLKVPSIDGDQNIWNFINKLPVNKLPINNSGASEPIFQWLASRVGVHAGRFTQDYPIYLGAIQGIGLAMILASYKKNRKKVAAIVGSSMFVAFLTGITEPLEFSFLFVAPSFYYLFYVPISGFAYMFMKIFKAHVGVGFARGFIDYVIYGIVPYQKGTNFYWAIPISIVFLIISFIVFFFVIKKFDIKTPGRLEEEIVLINKKAFLELKNQKSTNKEKTQNQNIEFSEQNKKEISENDQLIQELIKAYGGLENIESVNACATRLRVEVFDISLVDENAFKNLGAKGFIKKGNSTQAIYGGKAQILSSKINDIYFK